MLCAMSVMGGNGRHTIVVDERDDAKEAGKVTLSMVFGILFVTSIAILIVAHPQS